MVDGARQETDQVRVLVVDGSETVRDRLATTLSRTEYQPTVDWVTSGDTALAKLADDGFDAVVGGEELPDGELSGLELLSRLRDDQGDDLPFLYIGSYEADAAIDAALERGANRCLPRRAETPGWYRALADAVVAEVEHRRTVALLELTRDELRRIHDAVPMMITRKDTENRLLSVNEAVAEYLDRPREEIEGKTAWELFPDAGDAFYEMDRRVIESGDPIEGEVQQVTTPAGEDRWMRTHAVPYRDAAGAVTGVLVVSEDITELKERELELARQNERLDAFTSVVSHDLRNPLNVAQGRLALAREDCESEHLAAAEAAHERMAVLIEDLLTLAQEGHEVIDPEPVDLAALVDDSWAAVETRDAGLHTALDRAVRADESRLKQVFENLFRNAITHGGPAVTVTVGDLPDGFYVEDDGHGLPDDERNAVFEAGYSTSPQSPGFGLSIVSEIVEAHGWSIRATEATDGGARFEVTGVEFVDD